MRIAIAVFDGVDELDVFGTELAATTNHNARDELRAKGVTVLDERVLDDGDVVTAAGLGAGLDLGAWIVERLLGTETADRVCTSLEYARQGRVYPTSRAVAGDEAPSAGDRDRCRQGR
jgi:transcriptional regulator GlxA family with amidase domain